MNEKRKFTITYGKTVNTGNYSSKKLTLTEEFYVDEHNRDYEVDKIRAWVNGVLKENL